MKFAYIDESGVDDKPNDVFVMAGVLVDAYRLRKCTSDFDEKLKEFSKQHPSAPNDFKASKLINGKGGWKEILPDKRRNFFDDILTQVISVGKIYAFAMSFARFKKAVDNTTSLPSNQKKYWVASSLYVSALIQKKVQKENKRKGLTVLIFDDNKMDMPKLSDGLYECNDWYDDLYASPKKVGKKLVWQVERKNRFNYIINSAFSIKSQHSSLIQVADIISYIYRRHLELFSLDENYDGEKELYKDWVLKLKPLREKLGRCPEDSKAIQFYKAVCHPHWEI